MSRVLLDTNVVISALLFPQSVPARAVAHVLAGHHLVLTEWIIDECHRVVGHKRPDLRPVLDVLLAGIDYDLAAPVPRTASGVPIADPDDQPILDAALAAGVDIIVTGDRHFLDLRLEQPRIMTPRTFLEVHGHTV